VSKQQEPVSLSTLRGTVAVITGAGNDGIGWGLCCHAAGKLGMHVVAIDLHESLVHSAQERLRQQCPQVESFGLVCDVTKPDDLAKCVDNIK
jgi:NAD(P)-dependent dehydrogenase (short-subunit alcohol dehydrogenase family)